MATAGGLLAVASNYMEMRVSCDAFIKDPSLSLPAKSKVGQSKTEGHCKLLLPCVPIPRLAPHAYLYVNAKTVFISWTRRLTDVLGIKFWNDIKAPDLLREAAGEIANRLMLCLAKHFYHVRGWWVLLLTMAIRANKTKTQFVLARWIVTSSCSSVVPQTWSSIK